MIACIQRDDAGFSLVEVTVIMTVMAILAFGVMFGFTTSGIQDRRAFETTRNQSVAAALMEQIEAMTFTELEAMLGVPFNFTNDRWSFTVLISRVSRDLLSIDISAVVTAEDGENVRLSTFRARKEDNFS